MKKKGIKKDLNKNTKNLLKKLWIKNLIIDIR